MEIHGNVCISIRIRKNGFLLIYGIENFSYSKSFRIGIMTWDLLHHSTNFVELIFITVKPWFCNLQKWKKIRNWHERNQINFNQIATGGIGGLLPIDIIVISSHLLAIDVFRYWISEMLRLIGLVQCVYNSIAYIENLYNNIDCMSIWSAVCVVFLLQKKQKYNVHDPCSDWEMMPISIGRFALRQTHY